MANPKFYTQASLLEATDYQPPHSQDVQSEGEEEEEEEVEEGCPLPIPDQPQPSGENINDILANMFQEVPNSYREAMSSEDKDKWLATSQEEFGELTEMEVWKLVDRPGDCKTIKCRWTYILKADGRYKSRLVAKGYTQVQGIDYDHQ